MNAPERLALPMSADRLPQEAPRPSDDPYWRELISQIGSDIGQSLTSALERVTVLATTGKIDRAGLKALRDEIDRARRAGMIGQQMARYASGRIRQVPEQLSLTTLMREILVQRGREASARNLQIRQSLRPVDVIADATLLHALAQAVLDWAFELSCGSLELRVELKAWPAHALLVCRFDHLSDQALPEAVVASTDHVAALDTMSWRLVQQIARTLQLGVDRVDGARDCVLTIEFPRTVSDQLEGVSAVEIDPGFAASENSKPLAGSHVLVVASRRDLRNDVREATRHMGLLVDFVNSVDEAEEFVRDALPHAIVYESALAGDRFQRLCDSIQTEVPGFVFIEIAEEGDGFQLSSDNDARRASVGRNAVQESLPSALLFELSRTA
ncbi:MAG: hypothetical protein J0M20_09780 [Burkholderiales bacterium]|nr:hypothetical protein [Burkholderiales bacterium]